MVLLTMRPSRGPKCAIYRAVRRDTYRPLLELRQGYRLPVKTVSYMFHVCDPFV